MAAKGLNLLSMVLILAAGYNECTTIWNHRRTPLPPSKLIPREDAIKIDFFGIPEGSSICHCGSLTLQCKTSGNSTEHTIVIVKKAADGIFIDLTRPSQSVVQFKNDDYRCEDSGEYFCEVRYHSMTEIFKSFKVLPMHCPLVLCPLEGYTDNEKFFTVALFAPLQFNVCFLSPSDKPPKVIEFIREGGNDSRKPGTFQTNVTKKLDFSLRYSVKVYTEAIKPEDFGLWKISVADGEDKYGHKPVSFNLRVNAGGPPQCPLKVNVTEQTNSSITVSWLPGHNGGAPQHFIVFYSRNSSADNREWQNSTVPLPSNSLYVSSTIDNLPAGTGFLFRVLAFNTFNSDTINVSACEEDTVTARTFDNHIEVDDKKPAPTSDNVISKISMLHITIGASVLAVIILMIVVTIIFICRKRAIKFTIAKETSDDWTGAEPHSQDQGDINGRPRECETLIINTVYGTNILCKQE